MSMRNVTGLSAMELSDALAQAEVTAIEVTRAHLEHIEQTEGSIRAFLHVSADSALETARQVDARRAAGEPVHDLAGVPVTVTDVVTTTGMPTTCGSQILDGWESPYDATVIERLKARGMPVIGKTNLDEFAMGSTCERSAFGPTRNPWDTSRVPGGSGGGSAAAVAGNQTPLALSTDTGGSIRQSSALTGTVGVKPSYGALPNHGVVSTATSLTQAGPLARSVTDAAALHDAIGGYPARDSTSQTGPSSGVLAAAQRADVSGMTIGVVSELGECAPQVRARFTEAIELLASAGAEITHVSCPGFARATSAYYVIMASEASSNMARFDAMRYGTRIPASSAERVMSASRGAGFGDEVKRRILLGTHALSSGYYDMYYRPAQQLRTRVAEDCAAAFERADVLMSPTIANTAFKLGEAPHDPVQMYNQDTTTVPANLAGIPALSIPSGLAENQLPAGVQFLAPLMADERLYNTGAALERLLTQQWNGPLLARAPKLEAAP